MSSSKNKASLTRREFFGVTASIVPGLSLMAVAASAVSASALAQAPAAKPSPAPAAGAPACSPVSDADPVAKAIKYVPDASKLADRPAKMGVEGKDQSCGNCQLFAKQGELNGQAVGKCTMLATGCVNSKGWCTAWVKKA